MFRFPKINLDSRQEFKAILMKNRRESLIEISNDFIEKVNRSLDEIDSFDLNIPKYITRDNQKSFNPLYLKINPRQQIIVEMKDKDGNKKKERFIISEKARSSSKDKGNKTFKCYSFEQTLKGKRCKFEGKVLQLKSDETIISDGVLDVFERETGWKIGYVDPKARVEIIKGMDTVKVDLFSNYQKDKVEAEKLLWEKDVNTTIAPETPLYLNITYGNLRCYNGEKLLYTDTITNIITEPLYTNITHIKAYHHSIANARYSIRYVFTLSDGVEVERICSFMNIVNKKITADEIFLNWETGKIIEKEHVKIINVEAMDDSWFAVMNDFMEQFNSVAIYDSYEKKINVIHKDNLGKNAPYLLSYDSNIINVNVTENSTYPNALKVIGKNGISIASENIFGGDTIYDMSYYTRNGIMSEELEGAWNRYLILLEKKQGEWELLNNARYSIQQKKTVQDSEAKSLTDRIRYLNNLLSAYIAENEKDKQAQTKDEITQLEVRLNECLANIKMFQEQLDRYDEDMSIISNEIKKENATDASGKIFAKLDLEELNDIETIEVHSDEYYSTPYGLLENSKLILREMCVPQIDFKVDVKNLIKLMAQDWNKVLLLGDLFRIEDSELTEELGDDKLRFVGYDYIPSKCKIENCIFTNKFKKNNKTNKLNNIGKQVNNTTNITRNFRDVWEESKLSNNFVGDLITGGFDLAAQQARGGGLRNYISINECGILLEDQNNRDNCMLISSGLICISEDGFKSSKVAITPSSINAEVIAGRVLLGEKLIITTEEGQFSIGLNETKDRMGVHIKDENKKDRIFLGLEKDSNGRQIAKLELKSVNGDEVVFSDEGFLNSWQAIFPDNLDSTHPMLVPITSDDGVSKYKKVVLTLYNTHYRAFENGAAVGGATTSSNGGGGTSSSGGGGTSEEAGGYEVDIFSSNPVNWGEGGQYPYARIATDPDDYTENGGKRTHGHEVPTQTLKHKHNIYYKRNPHSHTIQSHKHNISNHQHDIEGHKHELIYDIYESTKCENISVFVNDELVTSNLNGDVMQVDITSKMKLNQTNMVKITTEKNGRIVMNIRSKEFIRW